MRVPMGVMVDTPSGKLKAMVVDTVDKLEQPLAHMLPEITANVFTPLCIIILLFILDWRMALACMIVIPIGVLLLMGQMKDYKNRSDRYIEASSNMDSSLVEYVNGIEVKYSSDRDTLRVECKSAVFHADFLLLRPSRCCNSMGSAASRYASSGSSTLPMKL